MAPIAPSRMFRALWLGCVAFGLFAFATLVFEHEPLYAVFALAAAAIVWGPLVGAAAAGVCWSLRRAHGGSAAH